MIRSSIAGALLGLIALPFTATLPPGLAPDFAPRQSGRTRFRDSFAMRPLRGKPRTKRKHARRASGTLRDQRSR